MNDSYKDVEQGWGLPNRARKRHYFVGTKRGQVSLCYRYRNAGPLNTGGYESWREDCATCTRTAQAEGRI